MTNVRSSRRGLTFTNVLTLVFITLKLTHFITWSWWWVLAPTWGPLAFLILLAALVGGIFLWQHRAITKD